MHSGYRVHLHLKIQCKQKGSLISKLNCIVISYSKVTAKSFVFSLAAIWGRFAYCCFCLQRFQCDFSCVLCTHIFPVICLWKIGMKVWNLFFYCWQICKCLSTIKKSSFSLPKLKITELIVEIWMGDSALAFSLCFLCFLTSFFCTPCLMIKKTLALFVKFLNRPHICLLSEIRIQTESFMTHNILRKLTIFSLFV